MGGVDLSDNFLHFYSLDRTHLKKYYKKIFFHLLNITILNTYILYKQSGGKKTRLNFTIELAEELIKKYAQPLDQQRRRSKAHNVSRFIDRHFPSIIPPTPNKEKPTKRLRTEHGEQMFAAFGMFALIAVLVVFPVAHTV
nr:unnamed protein product [Callosobruchus chinensis]